MGDDEVPLQSAQVLARDLRVRELPEAGADPVDDAALFDDAVDEGAGRAQPFAGRGRDRDVRAALPGDRGDVVEGQAVSVERERFGQGRSPAASGFVTRPPGAAGGLNRGGEAGR
jgi:hypothetical protein